MQDSGTGSRDAGPGGSQEAGYDMIKLSIVGQDSHTGEHVRRYYGTGHRMKYWGELGAFWAGICGLLFGVAFFAIPGLGPILAAGPVVAWIVGALEGAVVVGGLDALAALGILSPAGVLPLRGDAS